MNIVHRIIFFTLLLGAIVISCFAFNTNPIDMFYRFDIFDLLKLIYFFGFTVIFWPYFYYELIELSWSARGKNGLGYQKFYNIIKKDLFISLATAVTLLLIYWTDRSKYQFTGIDIGASAIPFIYFGFYTFIELKSLKIGGKKLNRRATNVMPAALLIFTVLAFTNLWNNSSGKFTDLQSIWYQITILFAGYYFYMSSNKQYFMLKRGHIEVPESQKYFFRHVLRSNSGLIERLEELADRKNKAIKKLKAQHSAELRKSKKRK